VKTSSITSDMPLVNELYSHCLITDWTQLYPGSYDIDERCSMSTQRGTQVLSVCSLVVTIELHS